LKKDELPVQLARHSPSATPLGTSARPMGKGPEKKIHVDTSRGRQMNSRPLSAQ